MTWRSGLMTRRTDDITEILSYFFKNLCTDQGVAFKPNREEDPHWKSSRCILEDRLAKGWTARDVANRMSDRAKINIKCSTLADVIPVIPPSSGSETVNLISGTEKYSHPILKIISPATYDEETGELLQEGEVIRREKFTLEDLTNYYISELSPPQPDRRKIMGALKYMLSNGTSLDVILSAIDLWRADSTDFMRGFNPWDLSNDWIPMAQADKDGAVSIATEPDDEDVED
jgi:hypothetical protein